MSTPFRIAVRTTGTELPRWIASALTDTAESVAVLVVADSPRASSPQSRILAAYERFDRFILGPTDDAEELVPLPSSAAILRVPDTADVGATLDAADVDLLLDLAGDGVASDSPIETWRLRFGRSGQAFPAFRDLASDSGVCRVVLEARAAGEDPVAIADVYAGTDEASLSRARTRVLWRASVMVARALRGRDRRAATDHDHTQPRDGDSRPVSAREVASWGMRAGRRVAARRARKVLGRDEWAVGVRPAVRLESGGPLDEALRRGPPLAPIPQPKTIYRADPFLAEHAGKSYLFVEEFSFARERGHISVAEVGPSGLSGPFRVCLERPYHLSYPFVFEHHGAFYLLPETFESRRIELYRATNFPSEWTLHSVILDGVYAVDSSVLFEGGQWWLFTNIIEPPASGGEELFLFRSESLSGPWFAHPQNPVVADARFARGAGRPFRHLGRLVRPAQDSSRRYGSAINLRYVSVLTEDEYAELPAGRLDERWFPGAHATHSYDRTDAIEVSDGERWRSKLSRRTTA